MHRRGGWVLGVASLAFVVCGCADQVKREQLQRVAKDWCEVIRASQVIPVYPLTEDVVPGDIFLVRMSIPHQQEEYAQKGFLSLDQAMGRLSGLDFGTMYQHSHGVTPERTNTPYHWLFPPDGTAPTTRAELAQLMQQAKTDQDVLKPAPVAGGQTAVPPSDNTPKIHTAPTLWSNAPRAAFPTYTFEVDLAGGAKVALPIHGVPVGMSIMQTDRANGSVTLSDAYTYGLPYDSLCASVRLWSEIPENKDVLSKIRNGVHRGNGWEAYGDSLSRLISLNCNERTVYIRVISRVYLVGRVNVMLLNARQGAFDVKAGAEQEFSLLNPELRVTDPKAPAPAAGATNPPAEGTAGTATAVKSYQTMLDEVTKNLGGRLKLEWASRRSVSMEETFDRPLVIGYLGFDFPVNADGSLGVPIATAAQLENIEPGITLPPVDLRYNTYMARLIDAYRNAPPANKATIDAEVARLGWGYSNYKSLIDKQDEARAKADATKKLKELNLDLKTKGIAIVVDP